MYLDLDFWILKIWEYFPKGGSPLSQSIHPSWATLGKMFEAPITQVSPVQFYFKHCPSRLCFSYLGQATLHYRLSNENKGYQNFKK